MVGEIEVFITQRVIDYLDELVFTLYKKEYFGFIESAEQYVQKIYDSIPEIIRLPTHQMSPKKLAHLGSFYIFYKSNKRTTWYIFFEKQQQKFLITELSTTTASKPCICKKKPNCVSLVFF